MGGHTKMGRSAVRVEAIIDSLETTRGLTFHIVDWWDRMQFFNNMSSTEELEFQFKVKILELLIVSCCSAALPEQVIDFPLSLYYFLVSIHTLY